MHIHDQRRHSAQRSSPASGDGGFTLVEVVVAMFVVMLVMASMTGLFIGSLTTVAQAKQRQTATALAMQTLERLRALPYDTVVAGINRSTSAYASDPLITGRDSAAPRFQPGTGGINEVLAVNSSTSTPPLANHRSTHPVEGVDYAVGVYVTRAATAQPSYNLTALVTYQSSVSRGLRTVVQRTTAYSPSGCLSTATHPFSGPCQASFTSQAGITAGAISITHPSDSTAQVPGFDRTGVTLSLPTASTTTRVEQTATTGASAQTTGVQLPGSPTTGSGAQLGSANADTDPSSTASSSSSFTTAPQTASPVQLTGSAGTITAVPSTADTASGAAQSAGSGGGCIGTGGTAVVSGQPCASSAVQATGAAASITADLSGTAGVRSIASFSLASVAGAPSAARAVGGRFTSANAMACSGVPDCAHAGVTRALGTVSGGDLPALAVGDEGPRNYTGAFQLTGFSEVARAESGVGARTPVLTRTGTLSYWTGAGYASLDVATVTTADRPIDIPAVSRTYVGADGASVTVTVKTSLSIGKSLLSSATTCVGAVACTAQATSVSDLRADMEYQVLTDGELTTHFAVVVDLGAALAETSYRAAPSA